MPSEEFPFLFSETLPEPSPKTVATGTDRARRYMTRLINNEKIGGQKKTFGPGILCALHREILFYYPEWAGQFRVDDETRVGGRRVALADELKDKVYLFERWLEEEVDQLRQDPENLTGAIRVAAAAHYGVTAELHPFDDGNGRVARTLMNGILVLNTKEALLYDIYILPVPILREPIDEQEIRHRLIRGQEVKLTGYLKALGDVNKSHRLNPLEVYVAQKWVDSLSNLLDKLQAKYQKSPRDKNWERRLGRSDKDLISKFRERQSRLLIFIDDNGYGRYPVDEVPNFFGLRLLAGSHV